MGERGRRVAAACLLSALIALAACTRVATTSAAGGLHPWTQPDNLRLASTDEPDSLNKLFANSDASDQVANLISAPIFRYDDKGEYGGRCRAERKVSIAPSARCTASRPVRPINGFRDWRLNLRDWKTRV